MNSCILMAEIVQEPQLRYTTDKMAIAEMLVQFSGLRAEDPPATLKVVGWGDLAQKIQQNYHQGDRVILEGRLSMNTVALEGYKEKRAELTVQKIHPLNGDIGYSATASTTIDSTGATPKEVASQQQSATSPVAQPQPAQSTPQAQPTYSLPTPEPDEDDIPF